MAFSSIGFDNKVAEALKRIRDSNENDDETCSKIESRVKQFRRHHNKDDQPEASVADIDESFTFGRRMVIDPNKRVEPEVLLSLKQLQETDEETAQILLASQPSCLYAENGEINQHYALHRCAVRVLVEDETDVLIQQLGCAAAHTNFRQEAVKLFEQFFEVCQRPNAAEIALLARVGIADPAAVTEWFNQKRERMKPLFIARAVSGGNGPVARYLRKERLGQGQQVTKKPLTRH